jgi:glycosyltransferase involved in cell wall biosynthesis
MTTKPSPSVSIITPTFNHGRFIGACIESVLKQSYANWEQIIIDDGSTDCTAEIIRSYKDPRIKYYHQKNQGIEALAHTYNNGLKEAHGELIAVLEGDDLWPPEKLVSLVPAFEDGRVVLAYGIPWEVNSEGELAPRPPKQVRKRIKLSRSILFNDPIWSALPFMLRADGHELVAPSTVIIRRSALDLIGGFQYFPNLCTTDFPTFSRLMTLGMFYFTPKIMGYRRRHPNSAVFVYIDSMLKTVTPLVSAMLDEFGSRLSQKERKSIESSWKGASYVGEFTRGRLALLRGEWRESRSHFRLAINVAVPRVCIAATVGWLISWFHCTLEPVHRWAGRSELKLPSYR